MRIPITTRLTMVLLIAGMFVFALPERVRAQDDPNESPLGDVARSFRKKTAPSEVVIDNDNFFKVVEDAETKRAAGSTMVFSLDPGAKNFHVSTPDVSCSFSFSAKTSSLLSDPIDLDELPRSELAKLDGPATIDGDSLQVSMHNGTTWDLREVVIGLTILRQPEGGDAASSHRAARIVPAVAGGAPPGQDGFQKQPDMTVLLRVKGAAAPAATALFRTQLNFALFPDQEWHWAIVRAKGVPPQAPAEVTTTQLDQVPGTLLSQPLQLPDSITKSAPVVPVLAPANPDALVH
ncbi:MAG TPA: hypothetical protein VGZ91_09380 [Candidatus Sulfotelmatobacter sp.]|nr:hypothetical protein [Candidatus Sulfotelmatobacter sp.]